MNNEIIINMEEEVLNGDILDIGMDNNGVIYNIYKNSNTDFNVEYIDDKNGLNFIKNNSYDVCAMFLSFSSIMLKANKKRFVKKIYEYLREGGVFYIWDLDKKYGRILNQSVKVKISDDMIKEIIFKEFNILKESSYESTKNILNDFFDIIDFKCLNGVYYIKAQKRRRNEYEKIENIISGDKF
ncbi:class I SAM-dependent methyltransferase [Clostridium massiliodielmoense]|uniref:class I SAM-dependent methyltransferase n=1 Tax=Clostridium massiliodielmoense TaxID=1776385 RepID=UPI000166A117|nr:class I SAM-dependent methyltransferase [Clostridium massiliodielmoense]EDS77434.1 conserved hypothetical protein [Clostridium botulinum C str. Eklund]KEH97859.1 hypothetical protein Z962_02000 [Clostridium botulinum C/D str. BKT12695]NEZ50173.1 class I SAM-dependent methyltransferase [Clostridium botulinum]